MPEGASFGLLQLGRTATTSGALLAPLAGLVLAGWTAVICILARLVIARRDVL